MGKFILAIDQSTSKSKALVFDHQGNVCSFESSEFTQYFPSPGEVEHDAEEIWNVTKAVVKQAAEDYKGEIAAIGITNQRETTVVWDAASGKPICKAIVWQDRRTSDYCDYLKDKGLSDMIQSKTGLLIDAYFSATKLRWILENIPGAREKAEKGELRFGTIDSWLVWKFTEGKVHVTDVSNASRTMLFNIHTLQWDKELLELLDIPESLLPEVRSNSEIYGYSDILGYSVPISGMAGDQQAALFGQMCTEPGSMKNTYGTGCFLLMNSGNKAIKSDNRLLTTVAWKLGDTVNYALEGSIFVAGSLLQWLRDGLKLFHKYTEASAMAESVPDNGGVYFVPALTGLGAPYWDQYAKGSMFGITRGTTSSHIIRASFEGIAFQVMDIVNAMERDAGVKTCELKVDGGVSVSNLMLQFQANLLDTQIVRSEVTETTALGAAYFAGLAVGFWNGIDEIKKLWKADRIFSPDGRDMSAEKEAWKDAINRTLTITK